MEGARPIALAAVLCAIGACTVSVPGDPDPAPSGGGEADAAPPATHHPDAGAPIGDVANYCNDFAAAVCSKLFSCLSQEERDAAGVPATEADCVAYQQEGCPTSSSAEICGEGEVYQADQAQPCVTQFAALSCEQFRDPDTDAVLAANAPACVALCQ
jgi:hypothetical protein